jgi:putative ATP-dependent endonuclease of OLD family
MFISKIKIQNFRLLQDSCFELDEEKKKALSLLVGRNNSGKTSLVVLLEKFLGNGSASKFSFEDFSIPLREQILAIEESTNVHAISIKLFVEIQYTENDSFENLADFILDLDPASNTVKLLFECSIDKKRLLRELAALQSRQPEFIKKNITDFLKTDVYIFDQYDEIEDDNREKLTKKEPQQINKLINLQVVHAKRNVASAETGTQGQKALSQLATKFFNKENQLSHDETNQINASILDMDATLDDKYDTHFTPLLANAKEFLNIDDLKVVSDLQSKEIISNYAKIVYGKADQQLPESFNGLGHMNILYLLLDIEIRSSLFTSQKSDINLLFIEEPEAHTHPQMQYVFIDKIKNMLAQIENLQTVISTHSSHIVKKCDFEDIRYFLKDEQQNNVSPLNRRATVSPAQQPGDKYLLFV